MTTNKIKRQLPNTVKARWRIGIHKLIGAPKTMHACSDWGVCGTRGAILCSFKSSLPDKLSVEEWNWVHFFAIKYEILSFFTCYNVWVWKRNLISNEIFLKAHCFFMNDPDKWAKTLDSGCLKAKSFANLNRISMLIACCGYCFYNYTVLQQKFV